MRHANRSYNTPMDGETEILWDAIVWDACMCIGSMDVVGITE